MPITNRSLPAGTILVGHYKGEVYRCAVLEREGRLTYSLGDDSIYLSLSAAASKVMGGVSANGWRFWSVEGERPEKPLSQPKPANTAASQRIRVIKRVPNQKGVPEGSTKWWCSCCMAAFVQEGAALPSNCPEGHSPEQTDDFSAPSATS